MPLETPKDRRTGLAEKLFSFSRTESSSSRKEALSDPIWISNLEVLSVCCESV